MCISMLIMFLIVQSWVYSLMGVHVLQGLIPGMLPFLLYILSLNHIAGVIEGGKFRKLFHIVIFENFTLKMFTTSILSLSALDDDDS